MGARCNLLKDVDIFRRNGMKLKDKFYVIAPIFMVTACGMNSDKGADLLNLDGEDTSVGALIGSGINTVKYERVGNCVNVGELKTQSGNNTANTVEYRLLEINSQQSLREAIGFSAQASYKGLGAKGSAKGSAKVDFSKSVNNNQNSKFLMVHVKVANQQEAASSYTYTEEVQNAIKAGNLQGNDFVKACGNEFVYGRKTGGEFYALFEYEFASSEEEMKFSAAIKFSAGAWKGSADLNEELSKFNMTARTQVRIFKAGGPAGNMPKIEKLKDFAEKFDGLVSAVGSSPITLELLTKSYDGVAPLALKPNPAVLRNQELTLNEMIQVTDAAKDILNNVRYIKLRAK